MPRTKYLSTKDPRWDLSVFPNFHRTGSIQGMKKMYYGKDALLVRSGNYIYKVTAEVYDQIK
jgi:hypothetical protein